MARQHPANWELPAWVQDGFEKEEMAASCETAQGHPFLMRGRPPGPGQRLYMQVCYDHDGSHPQAYRGWARMTGEVLPPPPAGLYGLYSGQEPDLPWDQLHELREHEPALRPSFVADCPCGREHTLQTTLVEEGAVHGQRLRARLRLSCDDAGMLEPQLAGEWSAELIYDDTRDYSWVLCKMAQISMEAEGGGCGYRLIAGEAACHSCA
ncbi:hypothetical protein ABPG75_000764 [Micractinium tetrahymenae]